MTSTSFVRLKNALNTRGTVLAACALALATAVGGSAAELAAVRQIQSYCTASWRNARIHPQEWEDCTQQVLVELLEQDPPVDLEEAITLPDSTARRKLYQAVWRISKRYQRQPRLVPLDARYAEALARKETGEWEDFAKWQLVQDLSLEHLSHRQQQILELSRDGLHPAEIARILHMDPNRVSDLKYKAIVKLRRQVQQV